MKTILLIILITIGSLSYGQTMIEMMSPGDADIILLEVYSKDSADVWVYKTTDKKESAQWDLMWRFKNWGFSNFSVYLAKDTSDLHVYAEDTYEEVETYYTPHAKVYFVDNKNDVGYKNKNFRIEGIMRKVYYIK